MIDPAVSHQGQEQSAPIVNDGPCVQDLVVADVLARKEVGRQRYGTVLQPFNGRDALRDAYEEALDLCQYLKQAMLEREALASASASPHPDNPHCENCGAIGVALQELLCLSCWEQEPEGPAFHWRDGVYFQRVDQGAVLLTLPSAWHVIPANEWASIVTHLSALPASASPHHEKSCISLTTALPCDCELAPHRAASASPQAKGEEWQPSDDATAELLAGLDELYPLPDDDKRCERAGRTAEVLKRWIQNEEVSLAKAAMVIMKRDLSAATDKYDEGWGAGYLEGRARLRKQLTPPSARPASLDEPQQP